MKVQFAEGEYVLSPAAARRIGARFLERLAYEGRHRA